MNMKKIICVALSVLMLTALLAGCGSKAPVSGTDIPKNTASLPASPTDVSAEPEATLAPDGHLQSLTICGIPVVKDGGVTGLGYTGAAYADGVLTLTNVNIEATAASNPAIAFAGDLEIVLVGENSVTATNGMSAIVGGEEEPNYAASLKISGDGSLSVNAEGENTSALACTGTVTIESTGTLEFTGGGNAISGEGGEVVYGEGVGVIEETETHVLIGKTAE